MDHNLVEIKNDVIKGNEVYVFREPIVLLPIICLSLLRGVVHSYDQTRFFSHIETGGLTEAIDYFNILQAFAPLPGIVLMTFLSEINGRKLPFILLFALTVLYSLLTYISYQQPWVMVGNFIIYAIKGGVLSMNALAICEYCNPKHRFACLVAHEVAKAIVVRVMTLLYDAEVLSKDSSYLLLCAAVVSLACLVSVWWWPESPYWLAARGRHAEARAALLRLRGEGAAARGELRALQASSRRPSPKLFWLALLIALVLISVAQCSTMTHIILLYKLPSAIPKTTNNIVVIFGIVIVSSIIVLVSYKNKRKIVYLGATVIPFALVYIYSVCLFSYSDKMKNYPVLLYIAVATCTILLESGPLHLGLGLFMELTPQKYYTFISCITCMYFIGSFVPVFQITVKSIHWDSFPSFGFLLIYSTLALLGVALLFWLMPETKNLNILEIENVYLNRLYNYDKKAETGEVPLPATPIACTHL